MILNKITKIPSVKYKLSIYFDLLDRLTVGALEVGCGTGKKILEEQTGRPVTRIFVLRRFPFSNLWLIFPIHLGDTSRTASCWTKTRLCYHAVICARKEEKWIFNLAVGAHSLPASTSAPLRPSTLLWYASAYSHVVRRSNAHVILNLPIFSLRRGQ